MSRVSWFPALWHLFSLTQLERFRIDTTPRPNSAQKLARPGFGPPAEPARGVKTARRHAARIRAPQMQRAACRSGFGTWAPAVQLSV